MAWNKQKKAGKPAIKQNLGVYVHVPFCRQKCAYCDFYSRRCQDEKLMDTYCQAVGSHFQQYFREKGVFEIDTVYFGGGTPSLLGGKRLVALLAALRKCAQVSKTAEITVECNPESTDGKLLKQLRRAGVNRLSFGVQSSDDGELKALGRLHTFDQAKRAVEQAQSLGFDNISLDLMYGLPGQTMNKWEKSVYEVASLAPRHLSAYALKLEKGTPMYRQNPQLPDDDTQAEMYLNAVKWLAAAGFEQYEISNFAKPGFRSRHNSKYWDLSQYLGFGPSAHSFFGGKRFSFAADTQVYIQGVAGGPGLVEEADEVASFRRHGEYIMLRLRTTDGIEEEEFYRRFRLEFAPYAQKLQKYIQPGYCQYENGRWRLTPQGMFVSNAILVDLLDCTELV